MPRPTVEVDKDRLTSVINEVENSQTFSTQSALYQAVSDKYGDPKVTPSVVYLRIKQFGIQIKTAKAKVDPSIFRERLNNAIKTDDSITPKAKQTVEQLLMYADTEEKKKYLKLAKSVLKGSRKAAIKFNCIQCANFQPVEVKNCCVDTCPMWLFRPYQ